MDASVRVTGENLPRPIRIAENPGVLKVFLVDFLGRIRVELSFLFEIEVVNLLFFTSGSSHKSNPNSTK